MNIDEVDKVIKDLYDSLKTDNKIIWNQWKIASLSLIMFRYGINVIK